jgi:eukaryotic-like serine/threonine-protein kinase
MSRYTFGPFSLDPEARVLLRDGEPMRMAGKTLDVLVVLVQNPGRLIDKDELLSRVWAGTIVEEASLSQSIFTVRKILGDNPKDPRFIATVPGRGYQFVAPVTELTGETPQAPAPNAVVSRVIKRNKMVAISVIGVAFAAVGGLWFVLRRPAKAPAELVERRLTFNSSASPIGSAAISPDGKYLAYSDPAGIHVRLLSTGEERLIPTPAALPASASYVDSWFPNGTELLAHSRQVGGHGRMWAVSVMGKSSRELRGDATEGQVSPDGARIAFRTGIDMSEIWVMDSQGDNPYKVIGPSADEFLWSVQWSPDEQRLAYIRGQRSRQLIDTCDLRGSNRTSVVVASDPGAWVHSICWLPDKRIAYSRSDGELWQIGVDTQTGKPVGKPNRITRWAGFDLQGMGASADGTRLVLQKVTYPNQVYVGELAAGGKRMSPPQRLTNDEAHDLGTAWTADSKAVLFHSDRGGKWGIFKQGIGHGAAVPLVEGRESVFLPRLSPDGAWVLYWDIEVIPASHSPRYRLMRVPVNGGLPQLVFETTTTNFKDHHCARAPASLCVIVESQDEKRLTVTAFDPLKGKGRLLRTIEKPIHAEFAAGLSPDGSTFAFARGFQPEMRIRLLSLTGESDREIAVKGWPTMGSLDWSADGKGLYIGSNSAQGATLLFVDLNGTARVLWQSQEVGGGAFIGGVPSPDGRYLAIFGGARNSNAWLVEGF